MGGDQFREDQTELIASFFAIFYFSINLGSTVSSFVTPIIRSEFGYAVAFAVPAVLLIIATFIFIIGKRWYVIVKPTGLRNNALFKFLKVMFLAIKMSFSRDRNVLVESDTTSPTSSIPAATPTSNTSTTNTDDAPHWIDRARAKFTHKEVYDAKCVWRVCITLLPITVFWSLFDQHSSRFVFQAELMDRKVGSFEFGSDQITTINPILVIGLVIVFDRFIYKAIDKFVSSLPLGYHHNF